MTRVSRAERRGGERRTAVLLVENESVPTDRRVWIEASVLRDAGYDVTIVCPTGVDRELESAVEVDGISIRRFPLQRAEDGLAAFVVEYVTALWHMARIVWRLPGPIDVIHSANPPDFLFLVGLVPKARWGTKLVFDHHDLVPELFETRFEQPGLLARAVLRVVRLVERLNFAMADAVISTNESYRRIAVDRGGKDPDQVRVVRNARDTGTFREAVADPALKRGKPYLAVYVGRMGAQDGAQDAVRALARYRHDLGRDDLHTIFVGDGDAQPACKELAAELDVDDITEFVGWQDHDDVLRFLASADLGLATDPPGPLNDRSTMIKVVEYLAAGLPVVSFDLPESVVTAGEAALYAPGGDELALATNIARLLDDPVLRQDLAERTATQMAGPLSWETARDELLATYRYLETARV